MTNGLQRRVLAASGVALFLLGSVIAPMAHLRQHGGVDVETLDLTPLRDPETGRVDLAKLAVALGDHDENVPHTHGPGEPATHGEGSLEHFSLALMTGVAVLAGPLAAPVATWLPGSDQAPETQVPALAFLSAQRSQAPPV